MGHGYKPKYGSLLFLYPHAQLVWQKERCNLVYFKYFQNLYLNHHGRCLCRSSTHQQVLSTTGVRLQHTQLELVLVSKVCISTKQSFFAIQELLFNKIAEFGLYCPLTMM